MPDPRSLRFGFAFGLLVIAVAWIGFAWPEKQSLAPPAGEANAESSTRSAAVNDAVLVPSVSERTESVQNGPGAGAPIMPASKEKARVRIVDGQTGAPLAGVVVHATARIAGGAGGFTTNQNGEFEIVDSLRVGAWKLGLDDPETEHDSLVPDLVWLEPNTTTIVRRMRPNAYLQIEVRGPTGLPVAGATVNLARRAEDRTTSYRRLWTNDQGLLSLPWPPLGEGTSAWHATAFHAEEGSCAPVDLPDAEQPPVTVLQLEAGTRLELQVTDSVHAALPYLQVSLRSLALTQQAFVAQLTGGSEHLDQDGAHVWTQLPPGEYSLSLRSPVGFGWLKRNVTLGMQTERITWVVDAPAKPIALEGRLFEDTLEIFPAVHHFVEVRDGRTDELISGTRTDASGRFRLFGEASGEVVLYTALLDATIAFPPHVHRYPAGKRDVVLYGTEQLAEEVVLRVTDRATGAPIQSARLERSDSDLFVLAGSSDSRGLLVARVIRPNSYTLKAPGYAPLELSGARIVSRSSIELDAIGKD